MPIPLSLGRCVPLRPAHPASGGRVDGELTFEGDCLPTVAGAYQVVYVKRLPPVAASGGGVTGGFLPVWGGGSSAAASRVDASAIISAAQAVSLATGAPSPLPGASLTRSGALVLARSVAFYVDPPVQPGAPCTLRLPAPLQLAQQPPEPDILPVDVAAAASAPLAPQLAQPGATGTGAAVLSTEPTRWPDAAAPPPFEVKAPDASEAARIAERAAVAAPVKSSASDASEVDMPNRAAAPAPAAAPAAPTLADADDAWGGKYTKMLRARVPSDAVWARLIVSVGTGGR